jgi:hypothetical protein
MLRLSLLALLGISQVLASRFLIADYNDCIACVTNSDYWEYAGDTCRYFKPSGSSSNNVVSCMNDAPLYSNRFILRYTDASFPTSGSTFSWQYNIIVNATQEALGGFVEIYNSVN